MYEIITIFLLFMVLIVLYFIKISIGHREVLYHSLFEENQDGIFIFDKYGFIKEVNHASKLITGYSKEEFNEEHFVHYIYPDDLNIFKTHFQKSLKGNHCEFTIQFFHKNGREIPLSVKNIPLFKKGNVDGVYTLIRDITNQLLIQKQLNEALSQKESFFLSTKDAINITTLDRKVIYVNPSFEKMFGWTKDELIGTDLPIVPESFRETSEEMRIRLINGEHINDVEAEFVRKDQSTVEVSVTLSPLLDEFGVIQGIAAITRDISERKRYEEQLKQLAFYDTLTGVPNRRLFQDRLLQTIRKAKRKQTNLALFYLDCDRFKWVNDTYGHDTGDLLLKGFVERVESNTRETDTLARLGGDEFAIIVDGFDSIQDIARMANRIIQALRQPWNFNGNEFITTSSIGISIFPDDGIDVDTLLAHADKALYESKEKGRNMYHFFTNELATKIERNILLEDGLKMAIQNSHFHVVYQPQVDIQENQLIGLEVLLRYTHPKIGVISPTEFIPICEKIGIIDEVTEWVMNEAFNQQKVWEKKGYGEIPISINISPTTLENRAFLQTVQFYLDRFGTNPETIEFELTEDAFMHNMEHINKILDCLKRIGIKLSLDDFGAGYSSLKYLKDLPIDKIKIDRSFIVGIPYKEKEKAIIESILSLTQRLKGEVICEGVETEEQLSFLLDKGCRFVQGFYFSKPVPNDELETLLFTSKDFPL